MWDIASAIVGVIIGMILTLVIIWILFITRSFIFSICSSGQNTCTANDYFVDPGEALLNGAKLEDILFLQNGQLMYKRVPRRQDCIPSSDTQIVPITYPQFCEFSLTNGDKTVGQNSFFGSPSYSSANVEVMTSANCVPVRSNAIQSLQQNNLVVSGVPLVKWNTAGLTPLIPV